MAYAISIKASAERELGSLSRVLQRRLLERIAALASNPRPAGCIKLAGGGNYWRVRVGEYRVVYAIDDGKRVVAIQIVAHRRDVYRGM